MAKACGCGSSFASQACATKRRYPNLVKTKTRRSRSPHSLGPLPLVCNEETPWRRGEDKGAESYFAPALRRIIGIRRPY